MKDISAVLITVKRDGKNYLADTLDALACSDLLTSNRLASFTVKDSGDRESFAWALDVVGTLDVFMAGQDEPVCANVNVADALEVGAATGDPWVLLLEDDIAVIDRFFDSTGAWLDDQAESAFPFYPLGANYDGVVEASIRGCTAWAYPLEMFYGTQAVAFPREAALSIARHLRAHCYERSDNGTCYDLLMADWARLEGYEVALTPAPSFVQHIGMESAIRSRRAVHTFPSFPGSNWAYPLIKADKGEAA